MYHMLTNGVPEHATGDSSNEAGVLVAIVHRGPARLIVEVQLQATTEHDRSTENEEHQRVEDGGNQGCNEDLLFDN